jgi:DNA-binding MarR family transcriptional regulator
VTDPLTGNAGFLMTRLGLHSIARLRMLLLPVGLDPRHYGILANLARNDGQSQQQLADAIGIHRNAMVGLVDDLEGRGLVERRRHPSDRRAYALHLTATARDLLPRAAAAAEVLHDELLATLDDEEREQLMSLLGRVTGQAGLHPDLCPGMEEGDGCAPSVGREPRPEAPAPGRPHSTD